MGIEDRESDQLLESLHSELMALPSSARLDQVFELGSQYADAFEAFYLQYEVTIFYNSKPREFNRTILLVRKRHREVTEFITRSRSLRRERRIEVREFNMAVGATLESLRAMVELTELHTERAEAIIRDSSVSEFSPDIQVLMDFHSRTKTKLRALSDALAALFEPSDDA